MAKTSPDPEQLSFEQALAELEAVIDRIESGEVGLEESLKQYEAGMAMVQRCRAVLDKTEKRIAELTENTDGSLSVEGDEDEDR